MAYRAIKQGLVKPMPADIHLMVIKGATGIGKTTQVHSVLCDLNLPWYDPGSQDPKWWDGYDYEDIVVYDEFTAGPEWQIGYINRLTNKMPFGAEIKGSRIRLRPRAVIIITNYSWDEWFTHLPTNIRGTVKRRVRFLDFDKISQIQYIRALLRTTTANYLCLCGLVPLDVKDRYCDEAAAQVGLENYLALKLRCGGRPNTSTIPL